MKEEIKIATPFNSGEPAFPCGENVMLGVCAPSPGMTLRDYFAAKALAGDWAAVESGGITWPNNTEFAILLARAKLYYRQADAMMMARDL